MGVTDSGNNGRDSIGALSNGNQIEDQQMPINPFSNEQAGLCSDILNQYGQLIGEYSRLDDELWFCKSDDIDDDAMATTNEGLDSNLISSYEYIVRQERLSKPIENSVSVGGTSCVKETSSSLKVFSLDQSQTLSPVSVLHRRSYSSVRKKATKHLRREKGRFLKCNCHEALQSVGPRFAATELSQPIQPESYMESSLFEETTKPGPAKEPRTKKVSDLLQSSGGDNQVNQTGTPASRLGQGLDESGSWEGEQDPNPKSSTKRKQPRTAVKKCMHCESTKTPQWREGPTGHGTLCNACGVQYRHGRLFPEYRPLKSPTFNPDLHSNIKPDAKRKQPKMAIKKCMHCASTKTSEWREGPMGEGILCNACGVQDNHGRLSSDYHHHLNSPTVNPFLDSSPKPPPKKQPKKAAKKAVKKCMHCESTRTPQWREGPMGQGTLCNACGVQYRYGRLFPEYRPLQSPTYNPSLHSHLPKKVQQMRMNKNSTESAVSADSKQ